MPPQAVLSPGMSELCYRRALNIVRSNLSSLKSFDNKGESVASRLKHFDILTKECFNTFEHDSNIFSSYYSALTFINTLLPKHRQTQICLRSVTEQL